MNRFSEYKKTVNKILILVLIVLIEEEVKFGRKVDVYISRKKSLEGITLGRFRWLICHQRGSHKG